ncbi:MAG: aldose 1-epimerase [Steroidobacteraceae bacterium]
MIETGGELVLRVGAAQLGIVPSLGSALNYWRLGALDILRPGSARSRDPAHSGCFALAPFSNVIESGGLHFRGDFFPLAPNHPAEPLPIHGDAWLASWYVDQVSDARAETRYAHDGKQGFPFAYFVRQQIELGRATLRIRLVLRNADTRPMPAGLGLHPYFRKLSGTRLQAQHRGRWTGSGATPDKRFLVPGELPEAGIDECFADWKGFAELTGLAGDARITIQSSPAATALVVYSPARSDFVCVEPVSNVNDGINAFARGVSDTGVRVLEPGMSMELTTLFRIEE